jgi:hypothetical protein
MSSLTEKSHMTSLHNSEPTTSSRSLGTGSVLTWVVAVAALGFFLLGLRTVVFPASAAAFYGIPTQSPEALAFVQTYGARNIAISLVAAALLIFDMRKGLVALLAAVALVAALDFWIVSATSGTGPALKHLVYVAALAGLALATGLTGRR